MKKLLRLWPLLLPLAITATLYAQCHGVVQLQYNGQNIGTASTINFVCPGGGGGGGGGPTLNVTVNGGSTYNIPTNLRFDAGSNMTIAQGFDGTTLDVTFSSTGGGGSFSGDVNSTTNGYLSDSGTGNNLPIRGPVNIQSSTGTNNTTLTATAAGVLALSPGQTFATDNVTSSTGGALNLYAGGAGSANINLNPVGLGNVLFNNGRTFFGDAAADPSSTGGLFRNGTHIVWYNGSAAIDLDAGSPFSGDVSVTTQTYLNDSATNTGVLIRDTDGLVIGNNGNTTNATLTCTASGILALKAGQSFTVDTVFPTSANSSLILEPSGSGAGVLVQSGKALLTDNVTTTSSGALNIGSGGGNTNVTITASGTGQVGIGNGRMQFADAATNPATAGFLFRNATHLVWYNGSSAINLDAPPSTTFSGDINTTTFGFLTDGATSTPINLFDTDGVSIADDSNTKSARLKCLANNVLTLNSGQTFATDNITSTAGGPVNISAGGTSAANIVLTPSGTGQVGINNGRIAFADAATNPATAGNLFRNGTHIVWYNGSTAIDLDTASGTFSGDVSTTTQGYLNNTASGTAVQIRDDNGLELWNSAATTGVTLTCATAGVLTLKAGQMFATDNITSSTPGALAIASGGGNTAINLVPSGTGAVTIPSTNALSATRATFIQAGWNVGLSCNAAAGNTIGVTWSSISVSDGTDGLVLGSFTGSASCATAGPAINGRDQAGTFANNVWVYVYGIAKVDGSIPALLLSQSSTTPTLPTSYTKKSKPLTAFFTGAGTNIANTFYWYGGRAYYNVRIQILTSGTATSTTSLNTGSSTGIAIAVPPQANSIEYNLSIVGTVPAGNVSYSYDGINQMMTLGAVQVSTINNFFSVILPCNGQSGFYLMSTASDSVNFNVVSWGWNVN